LNVERKGVSEAKNRIRRRNTGARLAFDAKNPSDKPSPTHDDNGFIGNKNLEFEIQDDGTQLVRTKSMNVVFDGEDPELMDARIATDSMKTYDSDPNISDPDPEGIGKWAMDDLLPVIKALPKHIQSMIHLHTEEDNPASKLGAYGFFS